MRSRSSHRRPWSWSSIGRLIGYRGRPRDPVFLHRPDVRSTSFHPNISYPSFLPVVFPPDPPVRPVRFLFQSLVSLTLSPARLLVALFVPTRPGLNDLDTHATTHSFLLNLRSFILMVCRTHEQDGKQVTVLLGVEVSISLNSRVDDPTTTGRVRGGVRRRLGWGERDGRERARWGGGGVTHLERARASREQPSSQSQDH